MKLIKAHEEFEAGLSVGAGISTIAVALLLIGLIPTNEFRARLWFLLEGGGADVSLETLFLAVCWLPSLAVLGATRQFSFRAALGALFSAFAFVLALGNGIFKWLPEFTSLWSRLVLLVAFIGLAVIAMFWQRRRGLKRGTA